MATAAATTVPSVQRWILVPDGSTLTIKATADPPNVRVTIVMLKDNGEVTNFSSAQVLNQTVTVPIRSPRLYTLAVRMEFAGAATTLHFDARVTRPDGTLHGSPFRFDATRPPSVQHAQMSVFTAV